MPARHPSSTYPRRGALTRMSTWTALVLSFAAPVVHAAVLPSCRPSDSDLVCRLRSVLSTLETVAWILGVLLGMAVLTAVRVHKRKADRLSRDEFERNSR